MMIVMMLVVTITGNEGHNRNCSNPNYCSEPITRNSNFEGLTPFSHGNYIFWGADKLVVTLGLHTEIF